MTLPPCHSEALAHAAVGVGGTGWQRRGGAGAGGSGGFGGAAGGGAGEGVDRQPLVAERLPARP